MKAFILKWEKRLIAGLLAVAMLSGMIPRALADENESEIAEPAAKSESMLLKAGNGATDSSLPADEEEKEPGNDEQTTGETTRETTGETISGTIDESNEELLLEEELLGANDAEESDLLLLPEGAGVPALMSLMPRAVQTLHLSDALELAGTYDPKLIEQSGDVLLVRDGEGLILLSNVFPSEYAGKTISLMKTGNNALYNLTEQLTITKSDSSTVTYDFLGLGDAKDPFAGKLQYDGTSDGNILPIQSNLPLFNGLSTSATLSALQFVITSDNHTALLAASVSQSGTANWEIVLKKPIDGNSLTDFPAVIWAMEGETVTLSLTNDTGADLTCVSTGIFCDTLKSGSLMVNLCSENVSIKGSGLAGGFVGTMYDGTLTVDAESKMPQTVTAKSGSAGGYVGEMSGGTVTINSGTVSGVTATGGDAGGFVGKMTGGKLSIFGGSVTTVTATNGNAGRLAGYAENAEIEFNADYTASSTVTAGSSDGTVSNAGGIVGKAKDITLSPAEGITVTVSGTVTAPQGNAGGLIGDYENTQDKTFDLSRFSINVTVESTNEQNDDRCVGGVFGKLTNGGNLTITSETSISCTGKNAWHYGGIVGYYQSVGDNKLTHSLNISSVTVSPGNSKVENFGGIIGSIPNTCYVEMSGLEVIRSVTDPNPNFFGGLVASMGIGKSAALLNVDGNVTIQAGTKFDAENNGGLVGILYCGVVRLSGITTVSGEITAGGDQGRVVGRTDDGFVYAAVGWSLNSSLTGGASNIGNNGEVLRLNIDRTGSDTDVGNLLYFDKSAHTVTICSVPGNGTLTNEKDFLAFALCFNYAENHPDAGSNYPNITSPVLIYDKIEPNISVSLDRNIDLTGIGFTGIGEDNGMVFYPSSQSAAQKEADPFTGTFDGGGHTITLDMGNETGPLNARNINAYYNNHGRLSLFNSVGEGATIQNLTVAGSITVNILAGEGSNWPVSIAGVAAYQSGAVTYENVTSSVDITIKSEQTDLTDVMAAGMVGVCRKDTANNTVNLKGCTLSANITSNRKNAQCGLLGGRWLRTNVTFGDAEATGVTVSNATLMAGTNFGGLVSQATGCWDATANNSIHFTGTNTISGTSTEKDTRGLLVGTGIDNSDALYLKVGTWGSEGAYCVDSRAVTLGPGNSTYFDELVGITIGSKFGNDNAVVSLQAPQQNGEYTIDVGERNTYEGQTGYTLKNKKARYYYNLNVLDPSSDVEKLVLWGARQHAAANIRNCIYSNDTDNISVSGDLDLTGYSYYPVKPLGAVDIQGATLKFVYDGLNTQESGYKQPSDETHQHHLMHCGLLYNTGKNLTVSNTSIEGTVGKVGSGSGALICGNASGDAQAAETGQIAITLTGIILKGLKVDGAATPLLINQIETAVKLKVDDLTTGGGYSDGEEAASSLIGAVGTSSAKYLHLDFSNIALDSRKAASTSEVKNYGDVLVTYNTTKSIFTEATLLQSFQYASDSTGIYNFYKANSKVTYGVETSLSVQNAEEQYEYYDNDGGYIWDGLGDKRTDENTIGSYFNEVSYLPYVRDWKSTTDNHHELNVNKKPKDLTSGCGTYGDPYIITDGKQLSALAKFLDPTTAKSANRFVVKFNSGIINNFSLAATEYHTKKEAETEGSAIPDVKYTYTYAEDTGGTWDAAGETSISADKARTYLLNAYYKIDRNIALKDIDGLGAAQYPFSGVIVGKEAGVTTVSIERNASVSSFGGLIRYSRGSVVKDLKVDYSHATITVTNTAVPSSSNNPFFGGVVGYCMGGDTIIDNVSVTYGGKSVSLDGSMQRMIAAGGYVGLVGGAKGSDGYEKTGGGVVFRKMTSTTNPFAGAMASNSAADSTYFYCNPYVGRVLDGYACYDNPSYQSSNAFTLDNTDKNYTIPDLAAGTSDLEVDKDYNVTVNTAQGLWLLSAIVNSGASAMDSEGNYTEYDSSTVDAYQIGKPRTANYDNIGQDITDSAAQAAALADEAYWGGNGSATTGRVSRLVKNYTASESGNYYAARLTGKAGSNTVNNVVRLSLTTSIDMTPYGNGFRGIGASYGFVNYLGIFDEGRNDSTKELCYQRVMRRSIYASAVQGNNATITLSMNQKLYRNEVGSQDVNNTNWSNHGVGLFTNLGLPTGGCEVTDLKLTGTVKIGYYQDNGTDQDNADKIMGESGAGGFAAKTLYGGTSLTFDNLTLTDLTVAGAANVGGAIGSVNRDKVTLKFERITAKEIHVSSRFGKDGNVGGIVGYFAPQGGGSCTIGSTDEQSTFESITVEIAGNSSDWIAAGSLIGKCEKKQFTIQNCVISGKNSVTVSNSSKHCGGLIGCAGGGGKIDTVVISGMTVTTGKGTEGTGGLVGESQAGDTHLTIKNVTIGTENAPVLVWNKRTDGEPNAGGLVGYLNGGKNATIQNCSADHLYVLSKKRSGGLVGYYKYNALSVSNVSLSNAIVATTDSAGGSGLVVGYSENKPTNGYNILADSCKVGYNSKLTGDNLVGSTLEEKNYTARWVGRSGSGAASFVAVAVNGGALPDKDVVGTGTVKVIYADFPADTTDWTDNGSASPYVDVNPNSGLTVKNGSETITLTGNGVGYMDGKKTTSVLSAILEDSGKANKVYKNHGTNLNDLTEAYISTFQAEQGTLDCADFPVLVVLDTTTNVDTLLWKWIAALTNVSYSSVKSTVTGVSANVYNWNADSTAFVKEDAAHALSCASNIFTLSDENDNGQQRFTLVDVQYKNPVEPSKSFHLYLPVLVKKVLTVKATVDMLPGTNYYSGDYSQKDSYVTAGFDEPVTAYIKYTYDRTPKEWQAALETENSCNWYYEKVLNLTTNDSTLPAGTRLTLVDQQTGRVYTDTLTGTENQRAYNLKNMTAPGGSTSFTPVPVSALLEKGADDKVTGVKAECYYLTIQIPSGNDREVFNNLLHCPIGALTGSNNAPAGSLKKAKDMRYVIYKGIDQSDITIGSTIIRESGPNPSDTLVKDSDTIQVKISTELTLNPAAAQAFRNYAPKNLYHQFNVSMRKILSGSPKVYAAMLEAESISWRYELKNGDNSLHEETGVTSPQNLDVLTINSGSKISSDFVGWMKTYDGVTVAATITMTYGNDVGSIFPARSGEDNAGLYVHCNSRLANEISQLPITTYVKDGDDNKHYFSSRPSDAEMTFEAAGNLYGTDHFRQLGINPLDPAQKNVEADSVYNQITAVGSYEYNPPLEMEWKDTKIRYTFELLQKTDDQENIYRDVAIGDYLTVAAAQIDGTGCAAIVSADERTITVESEFDTASMKSSVGITVKPYTGENLEGIEGYSYANYKLRVTAILVNNGEDLPSSQTSDFIVYTNAKILAKPLMQLP